MTEFDFKKGDKVIFTNVLGGTQRGEFVSLIGFNHNLARVRMETGIVTVVSVSRLKKEAENVG